jgi:hypothetical protein
VIEQFGQSADWRTAVASVGEFEVQHSRRVAKCPIVRAAQRPYGQRCLLLPLRAIGSAELYRQSVFGRCCQMRPVHRSSIQLLDCESRELWPTREWVGFELFEYKRA